MSKKTFHREGFLYWEDYCYDSCCARKESWVLSPKTATITVEYCDECDAERIFVDDADTKSIGADSIKMIQASLGREVKNGDFINVKFEVNVETADDVLLGVN